MPNSKVSFDCLREHAEIWEGLLAGLDDAGAVVGQEAVSTANGNDLTSGDYVRLVAYFEGEFAYTALEPLIELGRAITGQRVDLDLEILADEDWATKSQQGLERLKVQRLLVMSAEDEAPVPAGSLPLRIQAANAFGTGHHGTTYGCLQTVQHLNKRLRRPQARSYRIADVGCGTALLAFAAAKVMNPRSPILASDIDARAIPTAMANAKANQVARRVNFFVAPDVRHPRYRRRCGFDLVFANILSGLLIDMAPRLSQVVRPGGRLVLAGLLIDHAVSVERAYRHLGYRLEKRLHSGDWAVLTLRRIRPVAPRVSQRGDQRFHPLKGGQWMHW